MNTTPAASLRLPTSGLDPRRVLAGGLLAGGVLLASEFVLNTLLLGKSVAESTAAFRHLLGAGGVALLALNTLVLGVVVVWLHAATRERLGPRRSRWTAALVVWFLAWFHCALVTSALGLASPGSLWLTAAWGLVEVPLAAFAGAWLHDRAGRVGA
jgi:hypothetical protein